MRQVLGLGLGWRAVLMAGLRVGQAFGMLLLPGFLGTQPPCGTQVLNLI